MPTRRAPRPRRRPAAVTARRAAPMGLALAGLAVAGAACGSGSSAAPTRHGTAGLSSAGDAGTSPGASGGSGSSADVATSATPARGRSACAGGAIRTSVGSLGSSAEGPTVQVVFTNGSTTACTLTGYPAVQLLGAGDDPVGDPVRHTTGRSLSSVSLAPGATATATVQVAEPALYRCQGATVTGLQVTPPGSTGRALLVLPASARIQACTTTSTRYETPSALLPGTVTAVRAGGGSS